MGKFIIGLVMGIAIAAGLAYYLNNMPNQFVARVNNVLTNTTNASAPIILAPGTKLQEITASAPTAAATNSSAPSYDFYNVLQGENASDVQRKAAEVTQKINKKIANIYVEAGVFANQDTASNMTAQLTLLGYSPKIRTIQTGDKTVNQILIGPFANVDKANDVIKDLTKEKIQAAIYKEHIAE